MNIVARAVLHAGVLCRRAKSSRGDQQQEADRRDRAVVKTLLHMMRSVAVA
jgi:hypothetical protein